MSCHQYIHILLNALNASLLLPLRLLFLTFYIVGVVVVVVVVVAVN